MLVKRSWRNQKTLRALTLLGALAVPSSLFAQGCALCYQTAAASGARFIHALKGGILALLIPSVLIGVGIGLVVYQRRDDYDGDEVLPSE